MSLEHMLMEAARQQDEVAALAKQRSLPGPRDRVRMVKRSRTRWTELSDDQLDLVPVIIEFGGWKNVLDTSANDDLSLHRLLVQLDKAGIVEW